MLEVLLNSEEHSVDISRQEQIMIENLNKENYALIRSKNALLRQIDCLQGDLLLKNQIIEENKINS